MDPHSIASASAPSPQVGILVLNYHHPQETAACIRSLLAAEGPETRILWIENDAASTREQLDQELSRASFPWIYLQLEGTLPNPGTVGVILIPENLGYAGGNNAGLHFLHRHGIPFAWVLNNDTTLRKGSSKLLVDAAIARPEVGVWGTRIESNKGHYYGGFMNPRNISITLCTSIDGLENRPEAFVSGCSLFFRTAVGEGVGFLPEHYFLYYEDPAFSLELKRKGLALSALDTVVVDHIESLSTGRRSMLMEYYSKRNRWFFMATYYPHRLPANRWRLLYDLQGYLFRFRFRRAWVELLGFLDYRKGRHGPTHRNLSRFQLT
jgi:GT2 family glycosyltransferase